jgi:hypothetical protein
MISDLIGLAMQRFKKTTAFSSRSKIPTDLRKSGKKFYHTSDMANALQRQLDNIKPVHFDLTVKFGKITKVTVSKLSGV